MDTTCQCGIVHHQNRPPQHAETLRNTAARLVFPDWQPEPNDWTHLYTGFDHGDPYTEVAVYRDRTRVHYARITGVEVEPFWERVLTAHATL